MFQPSKCMACGWYKNVKDLIKGECDKCRKLRESVPAVKEKKTK